MCPRGRYPLNFFVWFSNKTPKKGSRLAPLLGPSFCWEACNLFVDRNLVAGDSLNPKVTVENHQV